VQRVARPRIGDVAERAGVSKTAVSFAFNRPERLNEATMERILAVAEELGYRPSPIARRLASRRTNQIGLVVPQSTHDIFANPFLPELIRGIGDVCDAQGIAVVVVPPVRGSIATAIEGALVDGLIMLGLEADHPQLQLVRRGGIPVVALDVGAWDGVPVIATDDAGGTKAAAEHLAALGHRDVAVVLIAGHPDSAVDENAGISARRMAGIRAGFGLDANGEGPVQLRIVSAPVSEEGGRAAFAALADDGLPTAVMAMSDVLAIGVMNAASDAGMRLPDDLSVVGFDDVELARYAGLTTVAQPLAVSGTKGAELLLSSLDGSEIPATRQHLPLELVVRSTTAPPGSGPVPMKAGGTGAVVERSG
jgi:DNA-binding LacI/PurR family transcriptional regulator